MKSVGIICEYNPFHNGHKRQIDILRDMGYDCIVCLMSGNYTQRGEPAVFDKYTRAEAAVFGGADLVLELPFPYSSLSAEGFAAAGVHILSAIGITTISFGSECGELALIERAADAVISPSFPDVYSMMMKGGRGSAAAYFEAVKLLSDCDASLLSNDILGISYISAIKRFGYDMKVVPIKREGAAYNEKNLSNTKLPSASAIREQVKNSGDGFERLIAGHIPEMSLSVLLSAKNKGLGPVYADTIGRDILSFFNLLSPEEISDRAISRSEGGKCIAEDGVGICDRICNAAKFSGSFEELLCRSYTSKYTSARINRVILFSLLGISDKAASILPEYTTLLSTNDVGRSFLSDLRKNGNFNVVTKPSDAPTDSILRKLSEASDSLYASAMPSNQSRDIFVKSRPFILKNKI